MKVTKLLAFLIFVLIASIACNKNNKENLDIDFSIKDSTISKIENDSVRILKVAVAAMISPKETFIFYQELIDYLAKKNKIRIILEQRKTYKEVNSLIESGKLDFAFICSGAYVELSPECKPDILAVPQTNGQNTYQAYIIANINSKVNKFKDFKGKSFAYTDPMSNSGRLYALKRVKEIGYRDDNFFSDIIYSNAHDNSIKLVNKGLVDGATIDGLIFNFLKVKNPDILTNIKVIEKSENYGIPPIVSRLDKKPVLDDIRNTLLNMDKDSLGKIILSKLLIDKFVPGYDSSYNSIRETINFVKK